MVELSARKPRAQPSFLFDTSAHACMRMHTDKRAHGRTHKKATDYRRESDPTSQAVCNASTLDTIACDLPFGLLLRQGQEGGGRERGRAPPGTDYGLE
jgi:hypothetical protein